MLQAQLRVERDWRETDDQPDQARRETRVGGSWMMRRRMETSDTRLDASVDLPAMGAQANRNVLGRLALTHGLLWPLNSLTASLDHSVDDNRGESLNATEELIGRRRRNATQGSASWQHQVSERLGTQASLSQTHTRFDAGRVAAEAFRETQGSASASYRWDELLNLTVQLSRSQFELDSGAGESRSDAISLAASRALTETSALSASLGAYRSERTTTLSGFACPLPVSFCDAGLVALVPVSQRLRAPESGSQYSLSYQGQWGPRTALSLAASRQLAGTGLGLVRSDSLSLSLNHGFTPHLNGSLTGNRSDSRAIGASGFNEPRVTGLEATLNWALAERWVLRTSAFARHFRETRSGVEFVSTQVSITLQYQGPTIFSVR